MKTATKKIVLTAKGEVNKNIANAILNCRIEGNKIYTCKWVGSGRRKNLVSYYNHIINILKAQGYKFKNGNDAPRFGAEGNYIKVSSVALKFIQSLV